MRGPWPLQDEIQFEPEIGEKLIFKASAISTTPLSISALAIKSKETNEVVFKSLQTNGQADGPSPILGKSHVFQRIHEEMAHASSSPPVSPFTLSTLNNLSELLESTLNQTDA